MIKIYRGTFCNPKVLRILKAIYLASWILIFSLTPVQADENQPSPESLKPFEEAKKTGDIPALLAVFRNAGQANNKDAVTTLLYAGLSDKILEGLSEEQTRQVLVGAQEVLAGMTDPQAWKVIYKAVSEHTNWRVRAMLLDVYKPLVPSEKRARRAIVTAITDTTDAVALKAIEMAGDLNIKEAVPKLMRVVIAKWGQNVGVGVAKATVALEKITGTTDPAGWYDWVNKNTP